MASDSNSSGVPPRATVLVVEDEASMREFLEILLHRNRYDVEVAENGARGIEALARREFDIVLTDLKMDPVGGLDVLKHVRAHHPDTEVVVITAYATTDTAIAAMKDGAYDYLTKPFKVDEILVTLQRALEKRSLVRTNIELREQLSGRYRLESLVGRSRAMLQVFDLVRTVARSRTSVLIHGESGTGKELVARAIHAQSDRADKPFVPVNCGAIPESLIESELYGHVRGAFTGADCAKIGLFAAADGGSVFLDEIAELPVTLQSKLLRTLQERTIKPVGAVAEQSIDVRIIAATNRDLDAEIAAGRFRSDLFYRLNVVPIALPPLRQRRDDVALLVDHFVEKHAAVAGKPIEGVAPDAMRMLREYHYPGNVRELENLVERAITLSASPLLGLSVFPDLQHHERAMTPRDSPALPAQGLDLDGYIARIEQQLLGAALDRTRGNRTEAARVLGITLRSLRYRLAKYGLEPDEGGG